MLIRPLPAMESYRKRQSDDRARWHAAGVPPVVVALMLRDQSAPPETTAAWYYSDLATAQIAADRQQGLNPPRLRRIAGFREAGHPTNSPFLSTWRRLSTQKVLEAIDRGFPDAGTFAEWSGTDADFSEVAPFLEGSTRRRLLSGRRWLELVRAGLSPGEIDLVAEVGIEPEDARKWSDTSNQPDRLRAWIESGFKAKSAKAWARATADPSIAQALIESGFTARDAERLVPEGGSTRSTVRAGFAE